MRQVKSPPTLRTFSALPRGPQKYKFSLEGDIKTGYGDPPYGFLEATNSITEWAVYWACCKILAPTVNPRTTGPPFMGIQGEFQYQVPMLGGRSLPGGAVPDFVLVRTPTGIPVVIRVQTERFHLYADNEKQVSDALQRQRLEDEVDVVDIFDYAFMDDPSGEAVIQTIKNAIGLIEMPDPIRGATVRRNAR